MEEIMQLLQFQTGDRVHTIKPLVTLPAHSNGVMRVIHHDYLEHLHLQERVAGTPDA